MHGANPAVSSLQSTSNMEEARYVKVASRFFLVVGDDDDGCADEGRGHHFLDACFLCKRGITSGRHIFMYNVLGYRRQRGYERAPSCGATVYGAAEPKPIWAATPPRRVDRFATSRSTCTILSPIGQQMLRLRITTQEDFQEYVHDPKSHWPTNAQIEDYNSGRKKWPCRLEPPFRCKCGILARQGVVPSELGKGWYRGNSYGDFWERRGYDWEYFSGQEEWLEEMSHPMLEAHRARRIEDRKNEIRSQYGVLVPRRQNSIKLDFDIRRDLGPPIGLFYTNSQRLDYWRQHRSRYAPGVPEGQEAREARDAWELMTERDREEYRRRHVAGVDLDATYPEGSWEARIQKGVRKRRASARGEQVIDLDDE